MLVFGVGMLRFCGATLAIDPTRIAAAIMLFLPDRYALLDFIDDESARIEGFAAVCGAHPDPHRHIAHTQRTETMDARDMLHREAPQRLPDDTLAFLDRQLLKRFIFEAGDFLAFVLIADPALETNVAAG